MNGRVRRIANWINLSTPLGLTLARATCTAIRLTADGHYLATGYRARLPIAGAFAVGDVVLTRAADRSGPTGPLAAGTWAHELHHSEQYAWCAGLPFLPAYTAAMGWSYLMAGDHWSYNVFETRAGLEAGGYVRASRRPWVRRLLARGAPSAQR